MTEQEFKERSQALMKAAFLTKYEFITLLNDYYKDAPDERGKKDTAFYRAMAYALDTFSCGVSNLRCRIDRPDIKFPDDPLFE